MYEILKSISEVGPLSILSELRQVSRGLHCVYAMLQPSLHVLFLLWAQILTLIYPCNVYFEFLSLV